MVKRHLMGSRLAAVLAVSIVVSTAAGGTGMPSYAKADSVTGQISTPSEWEDEEEETEDTGEDAEEDIEEVATPSELPTLEEQEKLPKTEEVVCEAPEEGLAFNADSREYAQLSQAVEVPETVEVWAKLKPGENRRQIILGNYGGGTLSWSVEVNADNTLRYWECRSDGTSLGSCKFDGSNNEAEIDICTGEWMLITIVRDREDNTVKAYINGELMGEEPLGNFRFEEEGAVTAKPTRLGTDYRSGAFYMDGELAEVRFWDHALTAEEVADHASYGVTGSEDGLVHAWDLASGTESGLVEDLAGDVDIELTGFQLDFEEPADETGEVFEMDFEDGEGGEWRNGNGGIFTRASVEDGVLVLSDMSQNNPVFLTGDGVPYTDNAVYEVRAMVSGSSDPVFGLCFRGSVERDEANWIALRNEDQPTVLAQSKDGDNGTWDDPWTDAEYALEADTWYDFRITYKGKSVTVEVKADGEADYTTLIDGTDSSTVWDGWNTGAGFVGFCGWGDTQDYYIDSIRVEPVENDQTHTVTFDLRGGAGTADSQTVGDGEQAAAPQGDAPVKEGFTFTGWYRDANCTDPWDFETDQVWADTVIYAGWEYIYQSAGFENMTGISFEDSSDQLALANRFSEVPRTFEATIRLPKELEGRGGVIVGNYMNAGYYDYDLGYVNLEIYEDGHPRLYWQQERRNQPGNGVQSVVFDSVDLRQDDWIHLAVTFDDENDVVRCYINGVLVDEKNGCTFTPVVPAQALKVGGDYRGTGGTVEDSGYNAQYFKGEIANVSIWSEVRTEEEIQADVEALKADPSDLGTSGEGLMAGLVFADPDASLYEDKSSAGNDAAAFVDWIDPGFAEGDYSMVALPDTQFLSQEYPDKYEGLTQWIADNKDTYHIQAVMHMGDMVNSNYSSQWNAAENAMSILDEAEIPWMPMRGNHDDHTAFNETFPYSQFAERSYFGGSYEHEELGKDELDSTCWEVTAGGRDYLIFSLGWAPDQNAINWADEIIKANPDKNVIITTHAFMYWDGTHLNDEDLDYTSAYVSDGMDGSEIWEQLGEGNPNVVLAIGGHIGFPDVIARTDENGAGREVTSLLCDAQGIDLDYGLGMMMLLTFHEDSDQVDINWFSTAEGKLFRERNQFSITVPHVDGGTEEPENPEEPEEPENPGNPEEPENPETPGNPETPENPEDPETPTEPENPADPGHSSSSGSDDGDGVISTGGNSTSQMQWQSWQSADGTAMWRLRRQDGTYVTGAVRVDENGIRTELPAWAQMGDIWYVFGADGYMKTGFVYDPAYEGWFFCDESGRMLTGWQQIDGTWYYFNTAPDGTRGRMYASAVTPDGYTVDEQGAWIPTA